MINDIVNEQLVQRRFGKTELIKAAAMILGFMVVMFIAFIGIVGFIGDFFIYLVAVGLITWGMTVLMKRMFIIEYEYLVVNGDLTVDRISARSKRKRILTLDMKNIEKIGPYTPQVKAEVKHDVFKNCSDSDEPPLGIYLLFRSAAGQNVLLVVSPKKKMRDAMKPYLSPRLLRESFNGGDFSNVYPE